MATKRSLVQLDETPQDVLLPSAPQWLATALIGPCMAGYETTLILFGMYIQAMLRHIVSGDISQHNRLVRGTMYLMLVLNLAYIGIMFQETYTSGVSNDRTFNTLYTGSLQWQLLPWLNGLIGATAEAFLTVRAASFFASRTPKIIFYIWMGALVTLVVVGSTLTLADGILYYKYADDSMLPVRWNTAVAIWLWASTAADVSISVVLTYNLRKRIAGFNRTTDELLRNLIWLGLRTASYTALLSLLGAIVATVWGDSAWTTTELQIAFWTPLAPLYGLSLLSTTTSGRRMINARVGSVSLGGPARQSLSGVFGPPAGSFNPRESGFSAGVDSSLGEIHAVGAGGRRMTGPRSSRAVPLQIAVQRVVHEVDECDDDKSGESSEATLPRDSMAMKEKGQTRFEV